MRAIQVVFVSLAAFSLGVEAVSHFPERRVIGIVIIALFQLLGRNQLLQIGYVLLVFEDTKADVALAIAKLSLLV